MKEHTAPDEHHAEYSIGSPCQLCRSCGWKSTGLRRELDRCPTCGGSVSPAEEIDFRRMWVRFDPTLNQFHFGPAYAATEVVLTEANIPDTLRFMARWYRGCEVSLPSAEQVRDLVTRALGALLEGRPGEARSALERLALQLAPARPQRSVA
jgi:hypothetical protein